MTEAASGGFPELQQEYLAELPGVLDELRRGVAALREGRDGAAGVLRTGFHRLAGSGGSYGFPRISEVARDAELWLADHPGPDAAARLDAAVAEMGELLAAVRHRAVPGGTESERLRELRVRLVLPAGRDRDQLAEALATIGVQVGFGGVRDDPAAVPPGARPDLLVIGTAAGEGDASAVASAWTARRERRPRAVVLVESLRAVDRLRAVAAGVDAVFPVERVLEELPRYVRTLARSGAPPSTILMIDPAGERATAVGALLDRAHVRVVRSPLARPVQELLDREVPDLLIVAARLADADPSAVIAMVRQDPRRQLLPVVVLGEVAAAERVAALRAGADDFLPWPVDSDLILQTVITRAERGRRLREMLHRDELTGLLNQGTLLTELEYAMEYARRHGGPLAFLVFDLNQFGRVNERFGHLIGDQVLLHVANTFRGSVRASDVIGRFGGEEFAMILRGGTAHGAAVLAAKLRRLLGEQPATTAEGVIIPLDVSVGWAIYPGDGATAGELAHAAMRAMRKEKAERT